MNLAAERTPIVSLHFPGTALPALKKYDQRRNKQHGI
jgi:hypothetical protein